MKRAMATVEYVFLILIVVAALVGMSIYFKRALSGKWREVGDIFGHGRQYEPGVTILSANSQGSQNNHA